MKKDELNNLNVNNTDGEFHVDESSLSNIKEISEVPEIEKSESEVFQASEENKSEEVNESSSFDHGTNQEIDTTSSSTAGASSASAAVGAVGGVVGVVAASTVLVLGIVALPTIPTIDVTLISASSSSLSFSLNTNIEDHSTLTISLKGVDYEVSTPFQEYVKFTELKKNETYTLSVYDNDISRYSSSFFTNDKEEINNITINVTSYIDDKLYFYFEDAASGDKRYTVTVKNSAGEVIFIDEVNTPKQYEIDNVKEDVAIFVSVDGIISAGVQVFKPIYDYNNINWVWGEYGETVTAIIPSTNDTDDYYIRDIRNFEIERKEATCLEDGYSLRQAAFIGPDKNRYEDEKRFTLPSLGHDFSDITYTWSNNYHSCKATSTCSECGTSIEESVVTTESQIVTNTNVSYTKYVATFENDNFSTKVHYDDVTYGSYPQSIVNDSSVISGLDAQYGNPISQSGKWTTYNYYAEGNISSYMYYVDVDTNNDSKLDYRGVYFTDYRPINTTDELANSSYQYDNGYLVNTTYWFKYEPIEWNVLDQGNGQLFITSKVILDSQSYYHQMSEQAFSHNNGDGYANNYELSDIRLWLNNEFYNKAFNSDAIATTEVDNSLSSTLDSANQYVCNNTNDKVFLLSRYEMNKYLSSNDLGAYASDYAKCQGLCVGVSDNKGFWSLRTPYPNASHQVRYITNNGTTLYDSITKTSLGVRPACYINIE